LRRDERDNIILKIENAIEKLKSKNHDKWIKEDKYICKIEFFSTERIRWRWN
jgi:hypothetical protein